MMALKAESDPGSGWTGYRRLVIANLDELRKELDQIRANQQRTRVELELIKFKVTLAGLIAGFVASAAITVLKSIMN